MKKMVVGLVAVGVVMGLTGCMTRSNRIAAVTPPAIPLGAVETTATYDIIGEAVGTSSGGKLLGIFRVGGENKVGQIGGFMLLNPVEAAAVYNAIESVPTADALIAPRWSKTVENYLIYSSERVTVKGKAIRYNVSAQ